MRTLIVDDQALVRAGFRAIIEVEDDLEVVGEAGDGLEAVELTRRRQPNVILMDIRMPASAALALVQATPHALEVMFIGVGQALVPHRAAVQYAGVPNASSASGSDYAT